MAELGRYLEKTEAAQRRAQSVAAILARAGVATIDPDNPYAFTTLEQHAADAVDRIGGAAGLTGHQVIGAAFAQGTSDFPNLLVDSARAAALAGFDRSGETWPLWTGRGNIPDFRPFKRAGLEAFPELLEVPENGAYQSAILTDKGLTVQLASFGRIFHVTRQAIQADNLSEIISTPLRAGRAAAATLGDLAVTALTANATMGDGIALFHADHGNVIADGTAPSIAMLDRINTLFAAQVSNGRVIAPRIKYLLVPRAMEYQAAYISAASWAPLFGGPGTQIQVIGDHRLDAADASVWYALADPQICDTVELGLLNGDPRPRIEWHSRFTTDGAQMKIALDAVASPIDHRGMVRVTIPA